MNEQSVSYPVSDALGAALGAYRADPTPDAWRAVKDAVGSDSDSDGLDAVDTLIIDLASAHVGDDNDAKAAALSRLPQSRKDALEQLDAARPLEVLKPGNELEPPARDWILDAWLPAGRIAIFTGEGGSGKSFLALQLATAIASGSESWIATRTETEAAPSVLAEAAPVVYAGWEDEYTEIERRLMSIHAVHGGRPLNDNLHYRLPWRARAVVGALGAPVRAHQYGRRAQAGRRPDPGLVRRRWSAASGTRPQGRRVRRRREYTRPCPPLHGGLGCVGAIGGLCHSHSPPSAQGGR